MYVCMHACMHVRTYVRTYVCMYVRTYVCMHQVRKSTDSGVKWAECLILDSSVGLSASIQSADDLVFGTPGSNPAFSRGTQLVSFRFEYRLPVPEHRN